MTTEDIESYGKKVDDTSNRLLNLCDAWSREIDENGKNISEDIVQKIHSVIGKTQLLRNSKFKQFRGFLSDAQQKTIGKPVMLDDIRGFWETIYIQVNEVEKTFEQLEKLKQANYVEQSIDTVDVANGNVKKPAKKTTQVKKPVVSASSNLKNFISAQRERKKENGDAIFIAEKVAPSNGHT